jgi:hypothetical protein
MSGAVILDFQGNIKLGQIHYVLRKEDKFFPIPSLHCRHCHYTSVIRGNKPPIHCQNVRGFTDEKGIQHPPCQSYNWDVWPEGSYNPATNDCPHCAKIAALESELGLPPKTVGKRGPKFKKNQMD